MFCNKYDKEDNKMRNQTYERIMDLNKEQCLDAIRVFGGDAVTCLKMLEWSIAELRMVLVLFFSGCDLDYAIEIMG